MKLWPLHLLNLHSKHTHTHRQKSMAQVWVAVPNLYMKQLYRVADPVSQHALL